MSDIDEEENPDEGENMNEGESLNDVENPIDVKTSNEGEEPIAVEKPIDVKKPNEGENSIDVKKSDEEENSIDVKKPNEMENALKEIEEATRNVVAVGHGESADTKKRIESLESKISLIEDMVKNYKESKGEDLSLMENKIKEYVSAEQVEFIGEVRKNFEGLIKRIEDNEKKALPASDVDQKVDSLIQNLGAVIKEMDFWRNENETLKSTLEKNNALLRKIFETFEHEAEK